MTSLSLIVILLKFAKILLACMALVISFVLLWLLLQPSPSLQRHSLLKKLSRLRRQQPHPNACPYSKALMASITSVAWRSGFTLVQILSIRPSGLIQKETL